MRENEANLTVYGAPWCPDCRRAKQFLGEHRVAYQWFDVDSDPEGVRRIEELNGGKHSIPVIRFADQSILVEPTNAELAAKLGLQTRAMQQFYDLVVENAYALSNSFPRREGGQGVRYNARMETFADRRRAFAERQRRFIGVVGPCLIAALTILAIGAGSRLRGLPFPLLPALLLGTLAVGLMIVDPNRPAAKLWLFSLLCFLVFIILVVL